MNQVLRPTIGQMLQANPQSFHAEAAAYEGRFAEPARVAVIHTTAQVVSSEPVPASQGNPVLTRAAQDFIDAPRLGFLPRAALTAGALMLAGCDKMHQNDREFLKDGKEFAVLVWRRLTLQEDIFLGVMFWLQLALVAIPAALAYSEYVKK